MKPVQTFANLVAMRGGFRTMAGSSRSRVRPTLFVLAAVLLLGTSQAQAQTCAPQTIDISNVPDGSYGTFVIEGYQFTSPSPGTLNDMVVSGGDLFTTTVPENTLEITRAGGGTFTFVDLTGQTFQATPWKVTGSLAAALVAEDTYSSVGTSTFAAANLVGLAVDKITTIINQRTGSNLSITDVRLVAQLPCLQCRCGRSQYWLSRS